MDYTKPWASNFSYFVEAPPAVLPFTLVEVKSWLKLDPLDTSQDTIITLLIESVTNCCELITRRTLITTTFKTLRDSFRPTIQLLRSPFQSLVSFKYKVNSSPVDVDSTLFYTTLEKDYSRIILRVDKSYPTDEDDILQVIEIIFKAGFGDASTDIPPDLRVAMLNHIAALFENRGDCDLSSVDKSLPNASRMIYNKHRILKMTNG